MNTTPLWRRMRVANPPPVMRAHGGDYALMIRALAAAVPHQFTSAAAVYDWLLIEAKRAERGE